MKRQPNKNSPRHVFQRLSLRGLYSGGLYTGRICVTKSAKLIIDWARDYSWKEICVRNLHEAFTETRREDVDLSKTQPCKLDTQPQITLLKTNTQFKMR